MKVRGPFAIQSSGILVHQVYHLNTFFFFTFSTPQKRQVGIASCYVGLGRWGMCVKITSNMALISVAYKL